MKEVIDFIESYERGYTQTIVGATPYEINELENLVGRALPDFYKQFLFVMGKDMGSLTFEDILVTIDQIISFYKAAEWSPPDNYILIGIDCGVTGLNYFLECNNEQNQDAAVVRFPSEEEFSKEAYFYHLDTSLKDFLFSHIFSVKRMDKFNYDQTFYLSSSGSNDTDTSYIAQIIALIGYRAELQGFTRVGYGCSSYHFYDRDNAAIYMRVEKDYLGGTLAAQSTKTLSQLHHSLFQGIPVRKN